ncbi:hypothetical protein N7495_004423 [Penicillium taxi]|uniref:uncharacterized protein n=1 Tax=Penicillium taxi TaxID=168475 RepID=UPI002545741B|nr:uncharacterized protein N7495_004423 [Penicillium taxi]KAJ5899679.1 hypothetical protein N7495_004423 [Penicillium taxi]
MSFGTGGFGSGGGFGQNNQSTFGSSAFGTPNASGFGSNNTFGAGNTGGSLFGSANNSTTTPSGFGSTGGGFGANTQNNSGGFLGSQPRTGGFGGTAAPATGSLFGGATASAAPTFGTGAGTFGANATGTNAFGAPANTGGLFSGNKTTSAFGGSNTGTGGFGAGGGFGGAAATTTPAFGGAGTALQGSLPPCEGTGSTPFAPFTEKDTNSSVTNHYQSVNFMPAHSKWSFEELRLADYQQGRRYGNGSAQPGGFGNSNFTSAFGGAPAATATPTFGGGAANTGFGGATNTATGFGGSATTNNTFGASNTNPLFGAPKPTTGFGATPTSQPSSLFSGGTTATTGATGFGGTPAIGTGFGGASAGNSLFGNNQQQNKPTGFGGASAGGFGAGGGFGTPATTAAPFGANTSTTSTFGAPQQQTTGNAFGGGGGFNTNTQTQSKPFGASFGAPQQPSTGSTLFSGGTTAGTTGGTGLFSGQQQQGATSNIFGGGQTQPAATGSSLFSQNQQQQKPGGVFGGSLGGTGTGFGQQAAATGNSLFSQNQQQQKPGGVFGSSLGGTGSGFGQQASAPGNSLFSSQNQQQQQPSGSLWGASQSQQSQQPVPGSMSASLLDGNPYGNQSIFSGLPAPNAPSPGPLATPLASSMKQKQRTPLPVYQMTPNAANRLITPPKRGYGFSYSTSSSSASTPTGFSSSLLSSGPGSNSLRGSLSGSLRAPVGGSFGRSFSKSYSTSNLRKTFDPDSESVLAPGALQIGSGRSTSGLKRLTIDRSLRNDLFTRPTSLSPAAPAAITNGDDSAAKKRVSFGSTSPNMTGGVSGGELVRVESSSPDPTSEDLGFLRSTQRSSSSLNGVETTHRPEMESVFHDLAVVPENEELTEPVPTSTQLTLVPAVPAVPTSDPSPGEYWMKPSMAELNKMSRDQLKNVEDFTVGRQHCGQVTFNGTIDLTTVDLDNLFGGIVDIGVRKITVYPDENVKPPMGKGLNVPSTLHIENSWPRSRDKKRPSAINGPLLDKHIDRLQKVTDTEFIDYDLDTGTWVFKVPHFTTYGLDYDDEEGENLDPATLSAGPDNSTPKAQPQRDHPMSFEQSATFSIDESFVGSMIGVEDDTFDFKKRKLVPGSFGNQAMEVGDHDMSDEDDESFLAESSTGSTTENDYDVTESQQSGTSVVGSDEDEDMDMAGSFPNLHPPVERDDSRITERRDMDEDLTQSHFRPFGTPPKPRLNLSGDWADQLQRTISPRKQNRDALREIQANAFTDRPLFADAKAGNTTSPKKGFTNSIDLMNSLFQSPRKQNAPSMKAPKAQPKGFEWPYNKQPKTFAGDNHKMTAADAHFVEFHESFKPRWGPMDSIVLVNTDMKGGPLVGANKRWSQRHTIFSEGGDLSVLGYNQFPESKEILDVQKQQSKIRHVDGIPLVRLDKINLRQFASAPAKDEEHLVWQLANVLFNDDIEDDISAGVPPQLRHKFAHRIKKDRLTRLWSGIIREQHDHHLEHISSPEERAIHLLCANRVEDACKVLMDNRNLHLASLVAHIGRDATSQADVANQIEVWRQNNILSEMTDPVRALYELVAGNSLRSEGKSTGAIEDRVSTFVFSEQFHLDWLQAFGLRLWYSVTEDEPIEAAVAKFLDDLATGIEPAFPHPLSAGSRPSPQPDSDTLGRESPLWVLLKAYSAANGSTKVPTVELPAALLPESLSGDILTNRLSFQLHHVLSTVLGQIDAIKINQLQTDRLVRDYASEITASGDLDSALFILLHLSQPEDRQRAVQETLARFAAHLPGPNAGDSSEPDPTWVYLTHELQLPEAWLWVAKALFARYSGDATREVDFLIHGKHWNDAHATFCRVVGPTAVISRDYQTLESLITGFGDNPERKIRGWSSGGGIYEDFLRLATAPRGRRDVSRIGRLVYALVSVKDRVKGVSGLDGLEERVAFKEMSRAVAGWITQEGVQDIDSAAVLNLPLTVSSRIAQTVELSRRYYGTIMAGGV